MKALVDHQLKVKIAEGKILSHLDNLDLQQHVQPASIDLPIGKTIYHVKQKFLPFQKDISYLVEKLHTEKFDASQGCTLYKGQTYLIPCLNINFPEQLHGKISPKSSLGRIDVLIRTVVDYTGIFDTIQPGTAGQLWLEVTPQSFNIRVQTGSPLTQLMIFDLSQEAEPYDKNESFLFLDERKIEPEFYEDKMLLSVGIGCYAPLGFKARYTDEIIDLSKKAHYPRHRFFEELQLHDSGDHDKIVLEKGRFYIIPTKELVRVPPQYSIELVPSSHLMGELRVHYAGFFDPGFGADTGATGVLEIRPHEDIIVYDGQPICLMEVYTNTGIPHSLYGNSGNNYHLQKGARLAKFFC